MIDPELRDIIAPELAEGEELLWADKKHAVPDETPLFQKVDSEVQTFIGKAFNSLYRQRQGQYQTLVLQGGFYNVSDMVELEMKNLQKADDVIPLLLANFIAIPPPEEHED